MKIAAAIVTNLGGRTSHAAIVSRELGIPAVVGTDDATQKIRDGTEVTVSCAEGDDGFVYKGSLPFHVDSDHAHRPKTSKDRDDDEPWKSGRGLLPIVHP